VRRDLYARRTTTTGGKIFISTNHAATQEQGSARGTVRAMIIPHSVNIRDRHARSHLTSSSNPSLTERVRVCVTRQDAHGTAEPACMDNNYFRNFLAFRATSPSIRKSYKPTVTFTPKLKIQRDRARILAARQIPFNPP